MEEERTEKADEVVEALVDEVLGNTETASPTLPPELLTKLPALLSAFGGKKGAPDKQTALLLALKPYLGAKRCEAIDYITKVKGISDALKHL